MNFSPDNPRDWDPNHTLLRSPIAPHETAGLLRIRRAGTSGKAMSHMFKIRPQKLANELNRAMGLENEAHRAGIPVYDGTRVR